MRILIIFAFLLSFFILASALDPNIFLKVPPSDESSANSICQTLKDALGSEKITHDILLAKIDDNMEYSAIDDISRCLGDGHPMVTTDLKEPIISDKLRKAGLTIIEGSSINVETISSLFRKHFNATVWNHMSKVLFISHSEIPLLKSTNILFGTMRVGFLNVALMHKVDEKFEVYSADSIMTEQDPRKVRRSSSAEVNLFPDKFNNSKGFPIHIPAFDQPPIVETKSGRLTGKYVKFVDILEEKMNAVAKFHIVRNPFKLQDYMRQWQLHLTLNKILTKSTAPKLLTYEENGFCALIPKPPRTTVAELIFVKPFDRLVWMFLSLTFLACLVTWRLFLNRGTGDSFWLLMFGMFAMFVGQGVEFRRTHRVVLVILLQLIVAMVFVLSNGYQGVITSFMIQPERDNRIKSVEELLQSDMRILVTYYFAEIVKSAEEFQAINSRMEVSIPDASYEELSGFLSKAVTEKSVIIMQCDLAQNFSEKHEIVWKNYYLLPQNIFTGYGYLAVGVQNPYQEKFQHFMDMSFEAGLPQAWSLFLGRNYHEDSQIIQESEVLRLKDLSQVFYILIFGHVCATFVFLVEIFFHDFIDKLDLGYYASKMRNYVNELGTIKQRKLKQEEIELKKIRKLGKKSKRPKLEKPKVRRIDVQPVDSPV